MALFLINLIKQSIKIKPCLRSYSKVLQKPDKFLEDVPMYMTLSHDWTKQDAEKAYKLYEDMTIQEDFLTETEEMNIMKEIQGYMKRLKYEFDHWDNAIHGFRETERLNWNEDNTKAINRLRELAFPKDVAQLKHVHILDLAPKGYIKPHIDATRFCGNTIAGMSLLSDSVMRLVDDKNKNLSVDVLLKRRSVYVMKDSARYDYTHEILPNETSCFKNVQVPRDRRVSVICRNEP